jgi:rhamnogalacturonan endolyase
VIRPFGFEALFAVGILALPLACGSSDGSSASPDGAASSGSGASDSSNGGPGSGSSSGSGVGPGSSDAATDSSSAPATRPASDAGGEDSDAADAETANACATTGATSGALSLTATSTNITVNTGAGLVYVVPTDNASISSIRWNGTELNDQDKASQIASGVAGTATSRLLASGTVALITVDCGTLTQYFATRASENIVYMATYITAEPSVGELRWITRLKGNLLTGVPAQSNNTGSNGNIESTDVFGYADGHTTSKYYGNQQARDLGIRGVTGSGVGVFMSYGSRESSSGGPFFRDIQNQSSTSADSELYNYMNSGHEQTQGVRTGVLFGPYALSFTTGCTPDIPDFTWMSSLDLTGYVPASGRGSVVGSGITGRDSRYAYIVGFDNATAQYWAAADGNTGAFTSAGMKPGTYAMSIYKGELAVWTGTATVSAGAPTSVGTLAITADPSGTAAIWRIGDWDGTPLEFDNGSRLADMHPSDVRMSDWGPITYTVGSSTASSLPAVQFRGKNTPTTIKFNLTGAEVAAHLLKIGATSAYESGRPVVAINSWTSAAPAAPTQPDSRSVTIGTYRGNNMTYTYDVPASAFVVGANTLTVTVASGSSDLGTWLSANWAYDAVELGP